MLPRGWLLPIAGLLLIFAPDPAATIIEDAIEILQLLKEVGSGIQSTWGIIADVEDIKMPKEKRLLSKIGQISKRLDRVQESIDTKHNSMVSKILIQTPRTIRLELRLNKLAEALARIKWAENTMRRFADDHKTAERLTLEQFARSAVAHEAGSINDMLDTIHDLVTPNTSDLGILNTGLMELLLEAMKVNFNLATGGFGVPRRVHEAYGIQQGFPNYVCGILVYRECLQRQYTLQHI